jgi:hypothetical protein
VQGVRGLFKGMASPVMTVSLQNAVVFYAYGISERLLRARDPTLAYDSTPSPLSVVFAAGALQGSAPGCRTWLSNSTYRGLSWPACDALAY